MREYVMLYRCIMFIVLMLSFKEIEMFFGINTAIIVGISFISVMLISILIDGVDCSTD